MRKILLVISLFIFLVAKSQTGAVVDLEVENFSDSITVIIWKLDWENKIIYDRPRSIELSDSLTSISMRPGDWAVEYRIRDKIYSIMNLHIYGNLEYYRYTIYYGYKNVNFDEKIIDEIWIRVTYGDF